jgi:histidine triad (HIT) family protein
MASIFSKIADGSIPAYKVAEDDRFLAFLDINPLCKGHTLVIPKKEVDYFFDIEDADLQAMMVFAKRVAKGIRKVIPCKRIGLAVVGLEVPHAHIHLVPLQTGLDIDFSKPKIRMEPAEFTEIAGRIAESTGL